MNSNPNEASYEVVTGRILRIEADEEGRQTFTLRYPVTGGDLHCECDESLEIDLVQYGNKRVHVTGQPKRDDKGNIVEMRNVQDVRVPDLSPISLNRFLYNGSPVKLADPILLECRFDRTRQLICVKKPAVSIAVCAPTRDLLSEKLQQEVSILWTKILSSPGESLPRSWQKTRRYLLQATGLAPRRMPYLKAKAREHDKAIRRAVREDEKTRIQLQEIRRRPQLCDPAGKLTKDGRDYLKLVEHAKVFTRQYRNDSFDYGLEMGRLLVGSKEFLDRHHWYDTFLNDVELGRTTAFEFYKLADVVRSRLESFRGISRRKLFELRRYIEREKEGQSFQDIVDQILRDKKRIRSESLELLRLRLRDREEPDIKGLKTRISEVGGVRVIPAKNCKSLRIIWKSPNLEFQQYLLSEIQLILARRQDRPKERLSLRRR